jgi:hypothetical protein
MMGVDVVSEIEEILINEFSKAIDADILRSVQQIESDNDSLMKEK